MAVGGLFCAAQLYPRTLVVDRSGNEYIFGSNVTVSSGGRLQEGPPEKDDVTAEWS